eukprot:s631_g13.t1
MYEGAPQVDEDGYYLGPLPRKSGVPLIGRQDGAFRTAAAAQWPPALCEWVAEQMVASFLKNSDKKGEEPQRRQETESPASQGQHKSQEEDIDPFLPPCRGGEGKARGCIWKGGVVPFHDGGCLSSGRWDVRKRRYPDSSEWKDFRTKLRRCVVEEAGGKILEEVAAFCGGSEDVKEVAEGQPFRLRAMRRLLEMAGDGDYEFLRDAEVGFSVGVKHPLPRTPNSYERQVEWSLKDDPTAECALARENYPSAKLHEQHLRAHLEAEVAEGLVDKMTVQAFEEEFGPDRAIASLAVLVEDELTGKKRVIHDGSHGVRVNHRIKCQDKMRMPSGREKKHLLAGFKAAGEIAFSLIGDFGKAHRRFKYRRDEQGFLACKVAEEDDFVYVNKVGTFGITSTPYWWSRISGSLLRLCHYLLGPGIPVELLLYADDLESLGVGKEGRKGTVMAFIYMAAMGAPFKWGKQRGGLCTEWVGLTSDYGSYSFGLSRKRAEWLTGWMRGICKEKKVEPRIFAAGLGRLGFAATALQWEKPFLGPLYVWKMEEGRRLEEVKLPPPVEGSPRVVFTDARASDHDACIGGYLALHEDLKLCPWFSVEVGEDLAPWVRSRGGNPKRTIAALELLATLVATKLWAGRSNGKLVTRMKAFTDNRGNSFALNKGMSTKYPLTLLLMELAEELRERDVGMDLEWIRREDNTVADDLSNGRCDAFDPQLREEVTAEKLRWLVLGDLQKRSEEFYEELKSLKLQGKANRPGGGTHQVGELKLRSPRL